jgi:hypothetical protein
VSLKMDLVDDLADVMARIVVGWKEQTGIDLAEYHEVQRVMERYREFKREQERLVIVLDTKMAEIDAVIPPYADWGRQVQMDCNIFGLSVWQRIDGKIENVDPASVVFDVRD